MNDWRNACGTGPFLLTDYVPGSSITYERNPDYWMYDPLEPENRLPYVDTVKQLIIPDNSTRFAGMRTGKLDALHDHTWEDASSLLDTRPDLQTASLIAASDAIYMRLDKPELPFNDINVRRALSMAVNRESLVEDYWEGHAELFAYPVTSSPEFAPYYTPLEEMPESVQEIFTYNPEKARQLIIDAGYPDGFKFSVLVQSSDSDFVSILREYFMDVGVEMELQVKESTIYQSILRGRTHDEAVYTQCKGLSWPFRMIDVIPGNADNVAFVDDPKINEVYQQVCATVGKDDKALASLLKGIIPYQVSLCYGVILPAGEKYMIWQPWVKGYHGEFILGYATRSLYSKYLWIDKDLKKSLGY